MAEGNWLGVDRIEVSVLMDNVTDSLSTNPPNVTGEWSRLLTGGRLRKISGENICCANHGLSLLVTAVRDGEKKTLLLDAGPEGQGFRRNVAILGVDLGSVDVIVLSHGHWDHAGGLLAAVELARGDPAHGRAVDCYVHPGMFAPRATRRPNGEVYMHERIPDPAALAKAGANVINTREALFAGNGFFYVSGEIPRLTAYEKGLPGHLRRSDDGVSWEPDPLLMDERFVAVNIRGKGQFVFSSCSHAGIINVLNHARDTFPEVKLHGVMGGLHLSGVTEIAIPQTVSELKRFELKVIAPGHCTGWRAMNAIAREMEEQLVPLAVGKHFTI